MNIINRLLAMMYKEFIYIIRDKKMRIIIIIVPIVQSLVLGYAVNMDLKYVKTAVVDMDNSAESRELASKFFAGTMFNKVEETDMERAEEMILAGNVAMIINIPKGFQKKLQNSENSSVQIIIDATNSVSAGMASGYVTNVISLFNQEYLSKNATMPLYSGAIVEVRPWFNDNFESRNFFVPSIIAMLMIIISVLLSSMAIVHEKETGTMEQLIVSPITAVEFIIGKSIPFMIVSFFDVLLVIALTVFWFDIPVKGSLSILLLSSIIYIICNIGIGLIISAVSSTQQQAMMSTFMIIFPLILLSGFAFPIENMPEIIQSVTIINPVRYFLIIIRGVFMKGLSLDSLQIEMAALTALSIAYMTGAVLFLRKRLN